MKLDIIKEGSVSLSATKSEMPNTRCKIITDQMASLLKSAAAAGSTRHRLGPANLLPHWQTFKKRENYIANDQFSDFAFLNVFYANVVCVANNVKLKHLNVYFSWNIVRWKCFGQIMLTYFLRFSWNVFLFYVSAETYSFMSFSYTFYMYVSTLHTFTFMF